MKMLFRVFIATLALTIMAKNSFAGEIGHYLGGMFGPWDLMSPERGKKELALGAVYYNADTLRNGNGDKVRAVDLDLDVPEALAVIRYSTVQDILGANYSFLILPNYGKTSVNAHLANTNLGVDKDRTGWNDIYVVPANLTWEISDYYKISAQYAFWAPTGSYKSHRALNNGLGYWSHDFRLTGSFFPTGEETTLLSISGLYEYNTKKKGHDITPGDRFVLELGISHVYNKHLIAGLVATGNWEVTDTSGSEAGDNGKDHVYSFGPDIIIPMFDGSVNLNVRAQKEFAVKDRTEGYIVYSFLEYQF